MTTHEGRLVAPSDLKIGIAVSRFNELITERLLEGALWAWKRHGGVEANIEIARVPGAFELPLAAKALAGTGRFAAVVCLGAVIRGATTHYDYVCSAATSGIQSVGLESGLPVVFGVLTTDTLEQAFERAGSKDGNKGAEAMEVALEMSDLLRRIKS